MPKKKSTRSTGRAAPRPGTKRPRAASKARRAAAAPPLAEPQHSPLTIVGVGASAGGFEALAQLLGGVSPGSGEAYVVVQHLDPTHKGMLAELLQRTAPMPVVQARDGLAVEPGHVYVIAPGFDMTLREGALHLTKQPPQRSLHLPIDTFFRSLAAEQADRAVGVVLSGMGSDGTLGLRAIKEKAGATFAQEPATARFDGMPRSAIDAGVVDVVAPAGELPGRIHDLIRRASWLAPAEPGDLDAGGGLDKVLVLLRAQTGNDFSQYKKSTIARRVERRMGLHQLDRIGDYVRFLRANPKEVDLLFHELLIGVTSFFRDPAAWESLKTDVLPTLVAARRAGGVLRAWVPGCSTGEEAYSLAMAFKEALDPMRPVKTPTLQIFATDLDHEAIDRARQGVYPASIAADVSPERLRRFFVEEGGGYRVGKEIREMVVFAAQNVIMDPPFTKLDIVSCRNLLIYFSADLQKKLIPLFHYSLNAGGVLFLGSAETVGSFTNLFAPLEPKARIYRKLDQPAVAVPVEFPSSAGGAVAAPAAVEAAGEPAPSIKSAPPNIQVLADRILIQRFAPLGVLCNDRGDILYISGRSGKYLEPAVGKANLNVLAMARDELRYKLSKAFAAAARDEEPVAFTGHVGANGGTRAVEVKVQRLQEPRELRGTVLVVFADVPAAPSKKAARASTAKASPRVAELEQELQRAREEIQTTREEMQTSQEELKSTNEELQSTNEELQSTNEELLTSKEEMQSLNEELQTVNHELQAKVDELSRSNNDMKNLLNSTDVATLFLDAELRIRRFTTQVTKIINLIPADAGRPITDIVNNLDYPDLAADAVEVLRTLVFKERQAATRDGHWYTVRILPYRTLENVIDGVVITFTDAQTARALEFALREQAGRLRELAESLPNLVWVCRADGACEYVNHRWTTFTGLAAGELLGYGWWDLVHADERARAREAWREAVREGRIFDFELRLRAADGGYRWFKARAVPIKATSGAVEKWYATNTDVDDLKRAEEERKQSIDRLAAVLEGSRDGFIDFDGDLRVLVASRAAAERFGLEAADLVGRPLVNAVPSLEGTKLLLRLRDALRQRTATEFDAEFGGVVLQVRVQPHAQSSGAAAFLTKASRD